MNLGQKPSTDCRDFTDGKSECAALKLKEVIKSDAFQNLCHLRHLWIVFYSISRGGRGGSRRWHDGWV
ncbi:MAG: hypothetical protein WAU00_13840, partial [Caldilinea sp.]